MFSVSPIQILVNQIQVVTIIFVDRIARVEKIANRNKKSRTILFLEFQKRTVNVYIFILSRGQFNRLSPAVNRYLANSRNWRISADSALANLAIKSRRDAGTVTCRIHLDFFLAAVFDLAKRRRNSNVHLLLEVDNGHGIRLFIGFRREASTFDIPLVGIELVTQTAVKSSQIALFLADYRAGRSGVVTMPATNHRFRQPSVNVFRRIDVGALANKNQFSAVVASARRDDLDAEIINQNVANIIVDRRQSLAKLHVVEMNFRLIFDMTLAE